MSDANKKPLYTWIDIEISSNLLHDSSHQNLDSILDEIHATVLENYKKTYKWQQKYSLNISDKFMESFYEGQ
ncbi:MAG: hypothetical protein ACC612_10630 [Methanomethylovorans sp.]|uniref:hypothetical protein n=1 Tax=Methanomethylovorans sp. TaxID=2758717 RepID=UPI0035317332